MKTTVYFVDTNVPVLNPYFSLEFENPSKFIICRTVLDELDKIKTSKEGKEARNARTLLKLLEKEVMEGSKKWQILNHEVTSEYGDDDILISLVTVKGAVLLSHDRNLRLKAHSLGCKVQDYDFQEKDISFEGSLKILMSKKEIADFKETMTVTNPLYPWQHIEIMCPEDVLFSFFGVYNPLTEKIEQIANKSKYVMGITPRNTEQHLALWYMTNPDIKLVTISGKAGSGKTLISLAAGLAQVLNSKQYDKMLITRPIVTLGEQDIGFLPGDLDEKLSVWMQPIYDNIEFLSSFEDPNKRGSKKIKSLSAGELTEGGLLEVGALAYIRGRSIRNQYVIVDEAQNLTRAELKTILTRAGENTKIILTGDMDQIDIPHRKSGLRSIINAFVDSKLAAHITLLHSERSELAEESANRL